jgi:hypothetical protein
MQHGLGHAAWTRATWTWTWTYSMGMGMSHRHGHGHAARAVTCTIDCQGYTKSYEMTSWSRVTLTRKSQLISLKPLKMVLCFCGMVILKKKNNNRKK